MKKKANNQDILSLDEILNQTEAPDFLNVLYLQIL